MKRQLNESLLDFIKTEVGELKPHYYDTLQCLLSSLKNPEIQAYLGIGKTALSHRQQRLYDKFGVGSRVELLALYILFLEDRIEG